MKWSGSNCMAVLQKSKLWTLSINNLNLLVFLRLSIFIVRQISIWKGHWDFRFLIFRFKTFFGGTSYYWIAMLKIDHRSQLHAPGSRNFSPICSTYIEEGSDGTTFALSSKSILLLWVRSTLISNIKHIALG